MSIRYVCQLKSLRKRVCQLRTMLSSFQFVSDSWYCGKRRNGKVRKDSIHRNACLQRVKENAITVELFCTEVHSVSNSHPAISQQQNGPTNSPAMLRSVPRHFIFVSVGYHKDLTQLFISEGESRAKCYTTCYKRSSASMMRSSFRP